jgi:UDP-glucose 4-epimerase
MKIAVTGGAGFIGSNIVDAYVAAGHEVVVLDNLSSGKEANVNPQARIINVDITDKRILDIFEQERFEVLNHHAAQVSVRVSVDDPVMDATLNIMGGLNLYEACRKTGVRRVVFASSGGAVYGEQSYYPADEKHNQRPASPYGVTKLTNEKYLHYYELNYGLENVILRYTNVYGPRQSAHGEAGVVAIFTEKMLRGEQPIINGDGTQTRDYVYIDDVVRANILALEPKAKGIYNVCTNNEQSVNTLFQQLQFRTGSQCKKIHGPAKQGEQKRSRCSYRKISETLGWKPHVSLERGLELTVAWFRQQGVGAVHNGTSDGHTSSQAGGKTSAKPAKSSAAKTPRKKAATAASTASTTDTAMTTP